MIRKFVYGSTAHKRLDKCDMCKTQFSHDQEIVSKLGSNKSRRYCMKCAQKVGII